MSIQFPSAPVQTWTLCAALLYDCDAKSSLLQVKHCKHLLLSRLRALFAYIHPTLSHREPLPGRFVCGRSPAPNSSSTALRPRLLITAEVEANDLRDWKWSYGRGRAFHLLRNAVMFHFGEFAGCFFSCPYLPQLTLTA